MIESLFSELELLHTGLESKTKEFEEKLLTITEQ